MNFYSKRPFEYTFDTFEDMVNKTIFKKEFAYTGMIIDLVNDCEKKKKGIYVLEDTSDPTNPDNWKLLEEPHKFKVITLCGSSKFKEEFIEVAEKLSLEGNIIISLGLFGHADNKYDTVITDEIKEMLDKAHMQKIEMSDAIFVINKNGYIGKSTKNEIKYAMSLDKEVIYLEPTKYIFKGTFDSFRHLVFNTVYGKIKPSNGDVYIVGHAGRIMRDDLTCVVYNSFFERWERINILDCEIIKENNNYEID